MRLCELSRAAERVLCSGQVPGAAVRLPERDQQLAGVLVPAQAGALHQVERAGVVASGLLVGELRGRLVAGAARIADRLVEAGAPGLEEVVGELRQVRLGARLVQILERLADPPVQLQSARGGHVLVERVAHEHVREAEAPGRPRHRADQPRLDPLLEGGEELLLREPADALERLDVELATQDRREREHVPATLRLALDPLRDRLPDAVGDRQLRVRRSPRGRPTPGAGRPRPRTAGSRRSRRRPATPGRPPGPGPSPARAGGWWLPARAP